MANKPVVSFSADQKSEMKDAVNSFLHMRRLCKYVASW